ARCSGRRGLRRCRDVERLPRSHARAGTTKPGHALSRQSCQSRNPVKPAMNNSLTQDQIRQRVAELGQWFHNLDLCGVKTAPNHFLGDYPEVKWQRFASAVPKDLTGKSVLDVGCNAGFYSIQMKRRGAERVVGIDTDEQYLEQARFAAKVSGVEIEFRNLSVYG